MSIVVSEVLNYDQVVDKHINKWPFEDTLPFNDYLSEVQRHLKIMKFNPTSEQLDFLLTMPNVLLIDSTAGSGKTTTIVIKSILDEIIWGIEPYEIVFLTFSRQSANDMRDRRDQILRDCYGITNSARMQTLHALCYSFLSVFSYEPGGLYDFNKYKIIEDQMYSIEDMHQMDFELSKDPSTQMIASNGLNLTAEMESNRGQSLEKGNPADTRSVIDIYRRYINDESEQYAYLNSPEVIMDISNCISFQKERMLDDEQIKKERVFTTLPTKENHYFEIKDLVEDYKTMFEYFDFSDIQIKVLEILREHKDYLYDNHSFNTIFKPTALYVDEVQDMTPLQKTLIKELTDIQVKDGRTTSLTCIGDGDQTIYTWRGSDTLEFEKFKEIFDPEGNKSEMLMLSKNHRCGSAILEKGRELVENNTMRNPKNMVSVDRVGSFNLKPYTNSRNMVMSAVKEIEEVYKNQGEPGLEGTAVIYREHAQVMGIVVTLLRKGIPVLLARGAKVPYRHWIFKNMINMCEALMFESNTYYMGGLHRFTSLTKKQASKMIEEIDRQYKETGDRISWIDMLEKTSRSTTKEDITLLRNLSEGLKTQGVPVQPIFEHIYSLYQTHNLDFVLQNYISVERSELEAIEHFISNIQDDEDYVELMKNITKWDTLMDSYRLSQRGVRLMTLHATKGLEFERVIIIGLNNRYLPKEDYAKELDERNRLEYIEEERRLLYVGITRAINSCNVYADIVNPSRFLAEIDPEVAAQEVKREERRKKNLLETPEAFDRIEEGNFKNELGIIMNLIDM